MPKTTAAPKTKYFICLHAKCFIEPQEEGDFSWGWEVNGRYIVKGVSGSIRQSKEDLAEKLLNEPW